MEIPLAVEYFIFIFLTSLSTLQLIAAIRNKVELKILKNKETSTVLSILIILASFFWFFSVQDRNIQTYMEGAQLSTIFGFGAFLSLIITKILKKIYGHS